MELNEEEDGDGVSLLLQLDSILSSDPLIDELGFLHPSQLSSLHETSPPSPERLDCEQIRRSRVDKSVFWCADHKLAIVATALPQLYKAAKLAFLQVRRNYDACMKSREAVRQECLNDFEEKLMTYSRLIVVINSGNASAWNIRKGILKGVPNEVLVAELQLSSLALSYDPKCEEAWAHRRWAILGIVQTLYGGQILDHLLQGEMKLVEVVAERSRMNYRAWRHCCWLVTLMSPSQVLFELQRWKQWAQLHVADNCCFHFRRRLFQWLTNNGKFNEGRDAFLDEIKWNEGLIKLYTGREALWVHRRFLFFIWSKNFQLGVASSDRSCEKGEHKLQWQCLAKDEIEFADMCISACIGDTSEDAERQVIFAATYKLWVLLKWKGSHHWNITEADLWQKELYDMEHLLKNKGAHHINLWNGLFETIYRT